mgnify:CR=1 FL=1
MASRSAGTPSPVSADTGTIARGATPEAQARHAAALLASEKDGREHRIRTAAAERVNENATVDVGDRVLLALDPGLQGASAAAR